MSRPESILSLSERLKARAAVERRRGRTNIAADLRYASFCCGRLAALIIAEQAGAELDPIRRTQLCEEALTTWQRAHDA
jgi:hypothetical protein